MSILISVSGVSKSFSSRPLFESVTFAIESRERIGLIGPNGAGKSTLMRILAQQIQPDSGKISFQRALKAGYLEQVPTFTKDSTVESTVLEGTVDSHDWESLSRAREVMSKLNLNDPAAPIQSLSGGWKKRVALARELVRMPDILFLDEPTNHLDLDSILWLEGFLADAPFATLVITHDRYFLQKISNRILELDRRNPGGLLSIKGDYAHYLESKELLMSAQEQRETVLKNTLRRETEWLRRGAKARTTKQQARIDRAGDLKDEVGEIEYRNQTRKVQLDFQSTEKNPKKLIDLKKVSKSYGQRVIFPPIDLMICPGHRIGILGHNGCGKSTLVRTILGIEEPTHGEVIQAGSLQVAYFEQNREALNPTTTLAKTICPQGEYVQYRGSAVHIRSYLNRFLFDQGQMEMAVGKLSGGEQARLFIAKLMLQEANLLILDEPTNDLDLATLRVLEECLTDFPGAILLVTHDRYFLDQVATQILAFPPEGAKELKLQNFASFAQWETWYQSQLNLLRAQSPTSGKTTGGGSTPSGSKKRKLSFKEQRELDTMEENIQKAETALAEATAASELPENMSNATRLTEIVKEMDRLQSSIEQLYMRWSELSE